MWAEFYPQLARSANLVKHAHVNVPHRQMNVHALCMSFYLEHCLFKGKVTKSPSQLRIPFLTPSGASGFTMSCVFVGKCTDREN